MGTLHVGKLRSSYLSPVVSIAIFIFSRSALTRIGGGIIEGAGDDENVSRCPMGEHIFQTTLCTTIDIAIPAEVSGLLPMVLIQGTVGEVVGGNHETVK